MRADSCLHRELGGSDEIICHLFCWGSRGIRRLGEPSCLGARQDACSLTGSGKKRIAAGCEAKAKEMSWKMNISVVDSGANQIFFEKMDGAYLGSGDIALHKAQTSARFPFPTRGIEQLAYGKDLKGGMVPGLALVPGIIAFAGGLPIMTEDKVQIGAIGVSGGTADQDLCPGRYRSR
jgi:glc operon protein GlcG